MNLYDASKPEIFERGWENDKFAPISYINRLFCNRIDDDKLNRAKAKMAYTLDDSVSANVVEDPQAHYGIYRSKVIDLSKLDVDAVRKVINESPYKALEIESLREYIENTLKQLINKNCTRIAFSERYKNIIDRYNAGGSENEDYYEKLLQLIEELKREQNRATEMDLEEEELEKLLLNGNPLHLPFQGEKLRIYHKNGQFAAIYKWREEKHLYFPEKMF